MPRQLPKRLSARVVVYGNESGKSHSSKGKRRNCIHPSIHLRVALSKNISLEQVSLALSLVFSSLVLFFVAPCSGCVVVVVVAQPLRIICFLRRRGCFCLGRPPRVAQTLHGRFQPSTFVYPSTGLTLSRNPCFLEPAGRSGLLLIASKWMLRYVMVLLPSIR